jgi:osmotically-inducible protein OsmY
MINDTLKTNVHNKLAFEPGLNSNNINMSVENGIVTLSGTVRTFFEKKLAEKAVQNVRGVKGVLEELRASTQRSDKEIAEAAIRTLEWDVVIPKDKIQVTVENGEIRLTGEVAQQYQKEKAYHDVRSLYGVKNIFNHIEIKSSVSSQEISKKIMREFQRNAVLDAKNVQVQTEGSRVVLKGKVRSWAEFSEAKKAAWSVPGVTEVKEELSIVYL